MQSQAKYSTNLACPLVLQFIETRRQRRLVVDTAERAWMDPRGRFLFASRPIRSIGSGGNLTRWAVFALRPAAVPAGWPERALGRFNDAVCSMGSLFCVYVAKCLAWGNRSIPAQEEVDAEAALNSSDGISRCPVSPPRARKKKPEGQLDDPMTFRRWKRLSKSPTDRAFETDSPTEFTTRRGPEASAANPHD